ncbi:MAG: RNA polymerase sigma factor [Candidatus Hydrogenedentes bacterium]|nr:RNA polymerase sigma factor [Candidatus Hydrogenedentota bacterium]
MEKQEEIKLIIESLEGNEEAFRELIMAYQRAVYATGLSYLKDEELAKEVVQETFIAAYRNLSHLRDLQNFGKWLKEIATRVSLSYKIKEKRYQAEKFTDKVVRILRDSFQNIPTYTLEEIMELIDKLPERYKLPVVLKYLDGMSYEEISRFTGEPITEIKSILQRATKELRDMVLYKEGSLEKWQDAQK